MKTVKKAAFRNLGCKVNEYESVFMQQKMTEFGYEIVPFDSKADVYVINTCTVTNIADRKSRQMIHQARKRNPEAVIVAVGCYVQTDPEGASKDGGADLLIGNNHKKDLPQILERYFREGENKEIILSDLSGGCEYEDMQVESTAEHTRAYLKIEDGCNQFCSYCAIPLARGRVRSRRAEEIRTEAASLARNGYREVVLTGIHLSSYGIDLHAGEEGAPESYNEAAKTGGFTNRDLLSVIGILSETDGIERICLSSLEPRLITEEFLRGLKEYPKICPHFHLSLQSGSDATLRRMNRHYSTAEFRNGMELLRKFYEDPGITTDVIAGFPGETEKEFEESFSFIRDAGFSRLHVFPYSRRKGTVADRLPDQVGSAEKEERVKRLILLGENLEEAFAKRFEGREVSVLFEENKDGLFSGFTREYVRASGSFREDMTGRIVTLRPKEIKDGTLYF
ncbi:MAG: MiaB/RimO family radical SAM methylthiotransferase [Lachnospiraceae bacterium]|nr:MiaB/RimO family radical SAM methylthiotransferase [Lachnospiraceae bacterium]